MTGGADIGRGVMAVWNDLEPGVEAGFEAWYQRQHVPERLRVPGFREARRYVSEGGTPRYCAIYRLDNVDVLTSPAYLERLANPTRWTRRLMPSFRAMGRSPCTVTLDRGAGTGGAMTWIAAMNAPLNQAVPRALVAAAFERAGADPAVVRMQLWERELRLAGLTNPEQGLRSAADLVAAWIACIEGTHERPLVALSGAIAAAVNSADPQAELVCAPVYRLLWSVCANDAPPPCTDAQAGLE